jgi:hypothetical protein
MKKSENSVNKTNRTCSERKVRMILSSSIIQKSDYIYDLDLNILRKFEEDYFAKNEERPFEFYKISNKVIDQLILEFASCIKDSIYAEEYDTA